MFVDRLNRTVIVPRDSLARFTNISSTNGDVFWKDARRPVEIVLQRHWRQVRARLDSHTINGTDLILIPHSYDRDIMFNENTQNWRDPEGQSGGSFYYENSYFFMDQPGEWFLDIANDTVYYKSAGEASLDPLTIVAPKLDTLVSLNRAENIIFRGLTFQHANWSAINETGFHYRNLS